MKTLLFAALLAWASPGLAEPAADAPWKTVDDLVSSQQFAAAATKTEAILAAAKASHDDATWTKALIRTVQLRMGLHGYETAVRFLKDQPWPPSELSQVSLELFYAQALAGYLDAYSWEIRQREKVATRARRPEGVDRRADLRGSSPGLRPCVRASGSARQAAGVGARRIHRAQYLPEGHPRHAAGRRLLPSPHSFW